MPSLTSSEIQRSQLRANVAWGQTQPSQVNFKAIANGANTPLVGQAPRRTRIIFFPHSAGRYLVSNQPMTAVDQGLSVISGGPPIVMAAEDFGSVVSGEWYAWGTAAGIVVGWVDVSQGDML